MLGHYKTAISKKTSKQSTDAVRFTYIFIFSPLSKIMIYQESQGKQFLTSVHHYFDEAARHSTLPPGILEQIKICNSVYKVNFPVEVNGKIEVIEGIRAQNSHH